MVVFIYEANIKADRRKLPIWKKIKNKIGKSWCFKENN